MDVNNFKVVLQLFYVNEAKSNKSLKNKKITGIEILVLPFPDKDKSLAVPFRQREDTI